MKMKKMIVAVIATAGVLFAGAASASADLAQKNCGSCHALDTKKMGPAFKDIAKKFKGNATAEADLTAKLKSGKGHPAVKASDADLASILKWVLAQ
jgi:cytochrome c